MADVCAKVDPNCKNCNKAGLAILPVRYAAVPKGMAAKLPAPLEASRIKEVKAGKHYQYALRTLRQGYLYVFLEDHWLPPPTPDMLFSSLFSAYRVYSVAANGTLWVQPNPVNPEAVSEPPCCDSQHFSPASVLAISRADKSGLIWIAYSDHPWSLETLSLFAQDAKARAARMQKLDPKAWIASQKHEDGLPATRGNFQKIVEHHPAGVADILPHEKPTPIGMKDGAHFPVVLKKVVSWHQPTVVAGTPKNTLAHMERICSAEDGKKYPPLILALHDAVGVVHELNGFRNDAAAWIDEYNKELATKVHAASAIEAAKMGIAKRTGSDLDAAHENEEENHKRYDDTKRQQAAIDHRGDNRAIFRASENVDAEKTRRDDEFKKYRAKSVANSWGKYEKNIDPIALSGFNDKYSAFAVAATKLIDERTDDLIPWLEAPLFVDTLSDCHPGNLQDGLYFEDKIAKAIWGINSSPAGRQKLDAWAKEAKVTNKNLIWRAFALNQQSVIPDINNALVKVESGKDIYFAAQSWAATVADIKWNKIADLYKKAQTLANTNAKIIDGNKKTTNPQATMRTAHVTRWQFEHWFLSAGDRIFAQFFSKKVDSFIGEKVLKTMFLLRVGLEDKDVLALVEEEAKLEAIERQQVLRRIEATAAFVNLLEDEHGKIRPSAEVLQQRWQKLAEAADVADSKGAFNAAKDARIALVVAILEAFNTAKTLGKAYEKPDAKSILGLATAVSGLVAAVTDVAANITKGFYGDASMTYQRMKFAGGSLSSIASLGSSLSSWWSAEEARSEQRYVDAALNILLTGLSFASGVAGFIATLTYCGPFLEKVAKRQGLAAGTVRLLGLPAIGLARKLLETRAFKVASGLKFNLFTLGAQLVIYDLLPDEMETWCGHCAFGKTPKKWNLKQQSDEYFEAWRAVGAER